MMHKYFLATLMFMIFACSLGYTAPKQNQAATTNAPASTSAATLSALTSLNPSATKSSILSTPTVTPPSPNPELSLLTAHIQAIQVSDDDGRRTTDITPQQVKRWVDKANEIFAKASIRFIYDPTMDFAPLNSTLVNDMIGGQDSNWASEVEAGDQAAARYPGKLVVFFRNGPGSGRTGGGFSWADYNFVAMPGFNNTSVCGYSNMGAFAHEVGHYLGLAHPFVSVFNSVQDAEAYLSAHGNNPEAFDGDGLSDTPPDPFINTSQFQCNPSTQSVTLDGQVFQLPRENIMSYYSNGPTIDRTDLTPQQINIVRWMLNRRDTNKIATPTDRDIPGATDFTTLPIIDKHNVDSSVQDMSTWSIFLWKDNKQLFCGAQLNSTIDFPMTLSKSGKYNLELYATVAPDFGKIQTLVDGNPIGAPIDLYGLLVLPSGRISLGTIDLTAGSHTLSFRVSGKNKASNGYSFGLSQFSLTPE